MFLPGDKQATAEDEEAIDGEDCRQPCCGKSIPVHNRNDYNKTQQVERDGNKCSEKASYHNPKEPLCERNLIENTMRHGFTLDHAH